MPHRLLVTPGLSVLFAACAVAPGPRYLTPPLLRVQATCFAGTPLAQRIASAESRPAEPELAYEVELRLHYLEWMPETVLEPLPRRLALVFAERDGEPVRPASLIASGSRIAGGEDGAGWLERGLPEIPSVKMADLRAAVPAGVTGEFTATALDTLAIGPLGPARKQVRVRVGHARGEEGPVSVALIVEELTADPDLPGSVSELALPESIVQPEPDPLYEAAEDGRVLYRELLLLGERPLPDGNPLVLLFPSPFSGYGGAFAVDLAVRSGAKAGPGHARRLELCRQQVAAAAETLRERTRVAEPAELEALAVASAWRSLQEASTRRPGLAWLARVSNAPLAGELALVADEEMLGQWWRRLEGRPAPAGPSEAGWLLEKAAYELLIEIRNEENLPLAAEGALAQQAGAAGRITTVLEDALAESGSLDELHRELTAENLILLRDADPAVRIRAYDWLQARGSAPEGFDPLGPPKQRRNALAASLPRILELTGIDR